MKVRLARYALPDRPDWPLINESVPLGTEYEVLGYRADMEVVNPTHGRLRCPCFYLDGNGSVGFLPAGCFEAVAGVESPAPSSS